MDFGFAASWIIIPIQIFFLDLLLGADNAVVIALACRSLHPDEKRNAVLLGTGGAIVFRFLTTIAAGFLLATPYLKLASALVLIVIAINLVAQEEPDESDISADARLSSPSPHGRLWLAALLVIVVDAAMSLDNVVALAAVARGNVWLLAVGVLFSIPVLVSGSFFLANLLQRHPALVTVGGGVLGWVAGDMSIADAAIAGWVNAHAPALVLIAPPLGASYVLVQARFMVGDRQRNAEAKGARAARPAREARKPSLAGAPISRASAARLPQASQKAAGRERVGAPSAPDGPAERRGESAGLTRDRDAEDDRIVLIGLILLIIVVGGIGLLIYLRTTLMR